MSTILEALKNPLLRYMKGENAYPIPFDTIDGIAVRRGIDLCSEATKETMAGADYNLALADLLKWLSFAPDISQGGQSYAFKEGAQNRMLDLARYLYRKYGTDEDVASVPKPVYGYKGSRL